MRQRTLWLDAPNVLAACCGFDLCYKYIWYLVVYRTLPPDAHAWQAWCPKVRRCAPSGAGAPAAKKRLFGGDHR